MGYARRLMRSKLPVLIAGMMLLAASCNRSTTQTTMSTYNDGYVELAGQLVNVEVADDSQEMQRGLSGRESISEDEGMLFVYSSGTVPGFWMKDMLMPIDIIWIRNGRVVAISEQVQPEPGIPDDQLKIYNPGTQVDHVLEVQAGWSGKNGLKIGDEVKFFRS